MAINRVKALDTEQPADAVSLLHVPEDGSFLLLCGTYKLLSLDPHVEQKKVGTIKVYKIFLAKDASLYEERIFCIDLLDQTETSAILDLKW